MDRFYSFAEKAIERAGKAGERKRKFEREEAGALAKSRMAEVERRQLGETRRAAMTEAGAMARAKLGGAEGVAGGFTSSQMANLRKSAYDTADKEIERRRGLMAGEPGSFFMGKGKTQTPWAEDQITGERESIASKYLQGYMGGQQQVAPEETQGSGFLTTAGGDRYDVAGSKITKSRIPGAGNVSPARKALTATNLSAELTGTTSGAPGMQWGRAFQEAGKEISGVTKGIKAAWEKRKKPSPVYQPFGR